MVDVDAATTRQVRTLIEAQLRAFAADDAERAYAYAAPAIQAMFGSAQNFMAMVRQGYPVLLKPASVVFLAPVQSGSGPTAELLQAVQLTDAEGRSWLATYHLQRQPDRSWRIGGCELTINQGRAT